MKNATNQNINKLKESSGIRWIQDFFRLIILPIAIFLTYLWALISVIFPIFDSLHLPEWIIELLIIPFALVPIILPIFLLDVMDRISPITIIRKSLRKNIAQIQEIENSSKTDIEKIPEVLSLGEQVYKWMISLNRIMRYSFLLNKKSKETLLLLKDSTSKTILTILTDLRSDLQIRIREQQQTLEQARSEVEENIKGTTELNQVSELQQARLDWQIAQFEELQKVLIKG